jgi:hypothetical protein
MRLISVALWGDDPLYWKGAIENAKLAQKIFPGWTLRVYAVEGTQGLAELRSFGADVRELKDKGGIYPMAWRFWPVAEPNLDYVIIRDADSRLNVRDKAAVDEWIESGRTFHVLRDHPHHADWPMLGGLWGARGGAIPDMVRRTARWSRLRRSRELWARAIGRGPRRRGWRRKLDDMRFLEAEIWPIVRGDMVHHSSVPTQHPDAMPFPSHPPYDGFCGEIIRLPDAATP